MGQVNCCSKSNVVRGVIVPIQRLDSKKDEEPHPKDKIEIEEKVDSQKEDNLSILPDCHISSEEKHKVLASPSGSPIQRIKQQKSFKIITFHLADELNPKRKATIDDTIANNQPIRVKSRFQTTIDTSLNPHLKVSPQGSIKKMGRTHFCLDPKNSDKLRNSVSQISISSVHEMGKKMQNRDILSKIRNKNNQSSQREINIIGSKMNNQEVLSKYSHNINQMSPKSRVELSPTKAFENISSNLFHLRRGKKINSQFSELVPVCPKSYLQKQSSQTFSRKPSFDLINASIEECIERPETDENNEIQKLISESKISPKVDAVNQFPPLLQNKQNALEPRTYSSFRHMAKNAEKLFDCKIPEIKSGKNSNESLSEGEDGLELFIPAKKLDRMDSYSPKNHFKVSKDTPRSFQLEEVIEDDIFRPSKNKTYSGNYINPFKKQRTDDPSYLSGSNDKPTNKKITNDSTNNISSFNNNTSIINQKSMKLKEKRENYKILISQSPPKNIHEQQNV